MTMKDNQYMHPLIHLENNKTITNINNLNLNTSTIQTIAPKQLSNTSALPITPETRIWLQIEGPSAVARTHFGSPRYIRTPIKHILSIFLPVKTCSDPGRSIKFLGAFLSLPRQRSPIQAFLSIMACLTRKCTLFSNENIRFANVRLLICR